MYQTFDDEDDDDNDEKWLLNANNDDEDGDVMLTMIRLKCTNHVLQSS